MDVLTRGGWGALQPRRSDSPQLLNEGGVTTAPETGRDPSTLPSPPKRDHFDKLTATTLPKTRTTICHWTPTLRRVDLGTVSSPSRLHYGHPCGELGREETQVTSIVSSSPYRLGLCRLLGFGFDRSHRCKTCGLFELLKDTV